MPITDNTRGALQMTTAMIISGTVGWFVLAAGVSPRAAVFWRCLFGALAMLAVCGWLGQLRSGLLSRRQAGLCVLGGVALALNWTLLFGAYGHASISVATIVYHTQPFMLVALGALCFRRNRARASSPAQRWPSAAWRPSSRAGRQRLCMRAARSPPASRWPWAPRSSTRSPPSSPRA
ncbi:DMT family transporter [Achromobacter xylosoxidans]